MTHRDLPARRSKILLIKQLLVLTLYVLGLGLFVFSYSLLPVLLRSGLLDGMLQSAMSQKLGAKVTFARVGVVRPGVFSMDQFLIQGMHPALPNIYCPHIEAEMSGGPLPFSSLRFVKMSNPEVEMNVDLDGLRSTLEGAQHGLVLNVKGPVDIPALLIEDATVYGRLGQQPFSIRDIHARLDNPDGFNLPFKISGAPREEEKDSVRAGGAFHLTRTSGRLEITEFRSSIHTIDMDLSSDPSSPSPLHAKVNVSTLQIAKSLKIFLNEFLGMNIDALLSSEATIEITRDGYEKLHLTGRIESYTFVGRRIDIQDQKVPLSLSIDVRKKIGATDWEGQVTLENIKTTLQQNIGLTITKLAVPFRMSGSNEILHPSGDIIVTRCAMTEQITGMELMNVDAKLNFDLKIDPKGEIATGRIVLVVGQGEEEKSEPVEIIMSSGDLVTLPKIALKIVFDGTLDLKRRKIYFPELSFTVPDVGRLYMKGFAGFGPRGLEYDFTATSQAIPAPVLLNIARNLSWKVPLDELHGAVDLDAHFVHTEESFRARGAIEGRDITAQAGPVAINKASFRLPFHFFNGPATNHLPDEEEGVLSMGEIVLPDGRLEDMNIHVITRENLFALTQPLNFSMWGGTLNISGFECGDFMTRPYLRAGCSFSQLNLEKVAAGLGVDYSGGGRITGFFDEIAPDKDDLVFKGTAQAQVFGGSVIVHDVRIRNFLTNHPSTVCSLDLHDINLEEVCNTFAGQGLVHGTLVGNVYDLELYRGKISQFEADLHTEPRPGVVQKFDIKAVKKMFLAAEDPDSPVMAKLSMAPNALYYDAMGVYARLRGGKILIRGKYYKSSAPWDFIKELKMHDLATLRHNGGMRESRVEYIVFGSGWRSTVNLIVGDPGAMDTLGNLLQRLERMKDAE